MTKKSLSVLMSFLMLCISSAVYAADDEENKQKPKPAYVSLGKKPMVLNLGTDSKRLTFLQLQADVLVKDENAKEIVEANIPAIRHKLIVLLSEQKAVDMKTPAAREEIRKKVTTEVRDMIEGMTNNNDIDEILFSNFLVQ